MQDHFGLEIVGMIGGSSMINCHYLNYMLDRALIDAKLYLVHQKWQKKTMQFLQNFINRVQMIEYPVANK